MNIGSRRTVALGATLLALSLVAAACGPATEESPSGAASQAPASASSASSTAPSASAATSAGASAAASAPEGEETSVFELEPGDCFSVADEQEIETVLVVDCASPHLYEAYEVFDHEAGSDEAYPGDDEILEYADAECQVPFEEFVGIAYEDSIWYITSVTPSAETWAEGDREIVCTVALDPPSETTGSAEGSAE